MRYVSITFDDGREDNYSVAMPIMEKHGFAGTVYCTTGFIDGTWTKKEDWYSADKALSIEQLKALQDKGWEIALHGDKHITEANDTKTAIGKLESWGLLKKPVGMSLPDSKNESNALDVVRQFFPHQIAYIRGGRARDTRKLSTKILFGLYTYLNMQIAFNIFNKPSIIKLANPDLPILPSVVIRLSDDPQMILRFIETMPDGSLVSLMLHSIHPDEHTYKNDPWNWQKSKFEKFCAGLKQQQNRGFIQIMPMISVLERLNGEK